MKILFLTTASLSSNPRLLKEMLIAKNQGFEIATIAFRVGGWTDRSEDKIIQQHSINVQYISATRSPFFLWLVSSILWKVCKCLYSVFKNNLLIDVLASDKRTFLILLKARHIKDNFDLVIAHNHGAFYPAYWFSRKRKIPFVLDIEDYHPGERCSLMERRRREHIFEKVVSKSNFIYSASPLIERATLSLLKVPMKSAVINNVFPSADFSFEKNLTSKISLVWFSQNISSGRGLELIVPSVFERREDFQLVLIGNLNRVFYNEYLRNYSGCLLIKQTMSQAELNLEVCRHDIGLALELDRADYNRQLCLTNKIWAYYQAGLFILATDTSAQSLFMEANRAHGIPVKQSKESIDNALAYIVKEIKSIRSDKEKRFLDAKNYNWERESERLVKIWKEVATTNYSGRGKKN